MLAHALLRLRRRFPRLGGACRTEVCPPALRPKPAASALSWRFGLRDWLSTGWTALTPDLSRASPWSGHVVSVDEARLAPVRDEFVQALDDIRTERVDMLRGHIYMAASLRELWHLRPEVFRLVAVQFSQAEAQRRLDRLNRHFPTRSPRSGFGQLGTPAAGQRPDRQA